MPVSGQAGQPTTPAVQGDPADRRLGAHGPDTGPQSGPGDVGRRGGRGQDRTEFLELLGAFEVGELGHRQTGSFDRLGGGAGDGEQESPVRLGDGAGLGPVDDDHPHGVVRDHQWDDGERVEASTPQRGFDVRPVTSEVGDRLSDERDAPLHHVAHRTVGIERDEQVLALLLGLVAELPVRVEYTPFVRGGEHRGIDAELVAQRGEDRVGHLGRVGRRGQRPGHVLRALRRLGGHPPPPLIARVGSGRPELQVALIAESREPDGNAGGGHQGHDPQEMVELIVLARRRGEHQGEDGGVEADPGGTPGTGEGGGDERANGQKADQPELAPVDLIDDGDPRDPHHRNPGDHRLHAVLGREALLGRRSTGFWFHHLVSPPDRVAVGVDVSPNAIACSGRCPVPRWRSCG